MAGKYDKETKKFVGGLILRKFLKNYWNVLESLVE